MSKPKLKLWTRPIEGSQPVPAFESQGVTYYQFPNDLQMRSKRALAAMDVYRELEYNIDRKDLDAAFKAIEVQLNKGNLVEAAGLLRETRMRLTWITNLDLLYKLAAILYFDDSEDPAGIDEAYCAEKIARWKSDKAIPAFFLNKPIAAFLPFTDTSVLDTPLFSEIQNGQRKDRLKLLKQVSNTLSSTPNSKGENSYLHSQMEILKEPIPSKESPSKPTL